MELEIPFKRCLGCSKEFLLNTIRQHLARTNCRKNYSSEEFSELVEACEDYKRKKKNFSMKEYYQKSKTSSKDQEISSTSDKSEVLKVTKVKCKGCSKKISLNAIKNHLEMKQDCKNKHSQEDLTQLEKLCDASKKGKRKKSRKIYHEKRKKQKSTEVPSNQADALGKANVIDEVTAREEENYNFDEIEIPLDILPELISDDDGDDFTMELKKQNDSEIVYCKGCKKDFKNSTILKHVMHPAVKCKEFFTSSEVEEMMHNSKLRKKMTDSIWHHRNYKKNPTNYRRLKEAYTHNKKINIALYKVTKHYPYLPKNNVSQYAEQTDIGYIKMLLKVKKALKGKNHFEKRERLKFWDDYLFDGTPKHYTKDIANWKIDVQKEIKGHP